MGVFKLRSTTMAVILIAIGFLLGMSFTIAQAAAGLDQDWQNMPDGAYESPENALTGMIVGVTGLPERPSPSDWIPQNAIQVLQDRVIIDIKGAQWNVLTNTNSMDPVMDEGANAIQMVPSNPEQLQVGDIISYRSAYADGIIIHRIVHIGEDEDGWYAIAKGDNVPTSDPGRIRFSQILRVTVGIIY